MDTSTYLIKFLLGSYIDQDKYGKESKKDAVEMIETFNGYIQLSNYSKYRLIDQVISEAIVHFTTCAWAKKEQKVAGDILRNLSAENGGGTLYETLIQDARHR